MSAQSLVYLYNQRHSVVLLDQGGRATIRYQTVYAKNLILNRGIDNILEFAFINQEQKPVNISGKDIVCRILDRTGTEILLEKLLTPLLPVTGITSLQLSAQDLMNIVPQECYYTLEVSTTNNSYPAFVDSAGGARGVMRIVDSLFPEFVPSQVVTVPSHPQPVPGVPKTYFSSIIRGVDRPVSTIQFFFENFTGNIQLQASTLADFSMPYDLGPAIEYLEKTGTEASNIPGIHPYIRVKIYNSGTLPLTTDNMLAGDVTLILAR